MALDWNLLGQGPQFGNVLAAFQGGQQARKETDTKNALSRYSTDPEGAIAALNKVDPVMGMKLQADATARRKDTEQRAVFQEADPAKRQAAAAATGDPAFIKGVADMDEARRKQLHETNEAAGSTYYGLLQIPAGPQRVAAYQQVAPALKELGVPDFDPNDDNALKVKVNQAQSVDKIIAQTQAAEKARIDAANLEADNKRADETAAEARRHNQAGEGNDRSRLGLEAQRVGLEGQRVGLEGQRVAQTANGGLTPAQSRKAEGDLRKEFDALPEVKNYRIVNQAANTVRGIATASPSAQNDIALTYSVMKAYDPTSVVRESEFATAQNAAGVPDRIRNTFNKVLNGQRLNPQQRKEMASAVEGVAKTAQGRFDTIQDQYRGYASDYGASPEHVAPKAAAPAANVIHYDAKGNRVK